jgi:hypothetical protein
MLLGGVSLLIGLLAGAALGRDTPVDGTLRQLAAGPALMLAGLLALSAGWRNRRFESRARGLVALALLGAVGVAYFSPVNPCSAVTLYGLFVYLSAPGREAFRSRGRREHANGPELASPGPSPRNEDHEA